MTVTPSAAGRRLRRRAGAWIAAVALATPLLAASPAAAATPSPSPTPASTVSVGAAPAASGLVAANGVATLSVHVSNDTATTLPASPAIVSLARSPLDSPDALSAWIDEGSAPADLEEIVRTDFADLAPGADRTATIPLARADAEAPPALDGLGPGTYPVRVEVAGRDTRTVVTVEDAGAAPRGVGVVVPVTAGPQTAGILSRDRLAELTATDGALSQVLDAVTGTTAILAIDPAIPAAIRVLGTTAPATATAWLDALMALPNERFALQFGDADLATQVHAGVGSLLRPTTLTPYIDPASVVGATPAAWGDLDALLSVGPNALDDVFWPASGTAGADVVTTLDQLAGTDADALTLIPADTVAATSTRVVSGTADLATYDPRLSRELAVAAGTGDATSRAQVLATATARATLIGTDSLLVTVDRPAAISRSALRAAVTSVSGIPGATPLTLAAVRGSEAPVAVVDEIPADTERADALTELLRAEGDLSSFATVLVEPAQLTSRERTAILQLIGNAWLSDAAAWETAYAAHREATARTLDAVGVDNRGTVNFLATNAPIPVTVRNELPWPVSVVLVARTDDPRLIVQTSTPVEIGAAQNTRVDVPVEARVGSGDISLALQLRSLAMVEIGPTQTLEVAVRAEWEAVGLVVLIVVVAVLLALGILRTVLRIRRRRAGTADDDTPDDAGSSTAPASVDRTDS